MIEKRSRRADIDRAVMLADLYFLVGCVTVVVMVVLTVVGWVE